MSTNQGLNQLLRWGIENSEQVPTDRGPDGPTSGAPAPRPVDPEVLNAIFGGPSDADLMKEAMSAITSAETSLPNKLIAFDNFEQLVENIDNANNMTPLKLWEPLLEQLQSPEADMRKMAAWCLGTAVQNNLAAQGRALAAGAIPTLVAMSLNDEDANVRRKAVYALSSAVRNHQPAADVMADKLPSAMVGNGEGAKVDAADMEQIDGIMTRLREHTGSNG